MGKKHRSPAVTVFIYDQIQITFSARKVAIFFWTVHLSDLAAHGQNVSIPLDVDLYISTMRVSHGAAPSKCDIMEKMVKMWRFGCFLVMGYFLCVSALLWLSSWCSVAFPRSAVVLGL